MMKTLVAVSLLVLSLTSDMAMGSCENCKKRDNKECVRDECRCLAGYFYSPQSGKCLETCDKLSTTFTEFPKSMLEQGKALKEIYLGDADSDVETCKENCIDNKPDCIGFSLKRNDNSDRSRCFLFDVTPLDVYDQWRTTKGRWSFFQRDCE